MNIEPGQNLANATGLPDIPGYTVLCVLGAGGFSTVYRATQHSLQRDIALKVMSPLLSSDADLCARFMREAQDTASVSDHPNIVTVYEVGQSGANNYIAMQLLESSNLKQRIDVADTSYNPELVLYQICSALSFIHQRGFVHRDIKPANVLFNHQGDAMLSDFGIARISGRHTQLTQIGSVVGTAKYMSPEQSQGCTRLDAKADLYSLGVVAFEMLAGHAPFESHDPLQLMLKHRQDSVPELPKAHSKYQPIVNKLLAKKPEERYRSADDVMSELKNLNTQFHTYSDTSAKAPDKASSDSKPADNSPAATVILAASFALLATITGSLLFLQLKAEPDVPDEVLHCPELTAQQNRERDTLLELAHLHEAIGRLTHPPGSNALEAYSMAMEIDPCNAEIPLAVQQIRRQTG